MENNVDMFVLDVARLADMLIRSSNANPAAARQAADDMQELSDFLRSMRLTGHAACARLLVKLLQSDADSGLMLASELAMLVKQAISAIESGHAAPDHSAELAQLTASAHTIAPHLLKPQGGAISEAAGADMLLSVDHAMRMLSEMIITPEADTPVEAPAPQIDYALLAALQNEPRVPEQESRQKLVWLQAVHQVMATAPLPPDTRRALAHKLHALQDWTLALGQQKLEHVLGLPGLAGLKADAEVADALRYLIELLSPAHLVRGSCFALTLFIDIEGCNPSPQALSDAAAIVQQFGGRIEVRDEHLRLLLPTSLQRMRVVTIERDGQRYSLSWAQFIEVAELPEQEQAAQMDLLGRIDRPLLQITMQAGAQQHRILATSIAQAEEAPRLQCPQGLGLPFWLRGTILDKSGMFLPWVAP